MPDGNFPLADPSALKVCCATAYSHDWVSLLLGNSFHPGGPDLTRRVATTLELKAGERVLDLGSGSGNSAMLLASDHGVDVTGIDRSGSLAERASRRAIEEGLDQAVRFVAADAELLPFAGESFDVVLSECAFCTFPDKLSALREMRRVLRPAGRIGITDMTLDGPIDGWDHNSMGGWISCIGGALSQVGYCDLLSRAGFRLVVAEDQSEALIELMDRLEPRLLAAAILRPPAFPAFEPETVKHWIAVARRAVATKSAGYCLLTAEKLADPIV